MRYQDEIACEDAISHPYVSRKLCRLLGVLWLRHGRSALAWEAGCDHPPLRKKPELDPQLEKALDCAG